MILSRYILKLMASRILAALAVLMGILQVIDLLDITTDLISRNLGAGGIAYYCLLRLPRLFEQAAPLAVLAGALFAFAQLAQQSAVTALRSTGVSVYRIVLLAAPAALAVLVLNLAVSLVIAPRTDRTLDIWWRATTPAAQQKVVKPKTFRVGAEIVVATPADDSGRRLKDLSIYRRDDNGRLVQQTRADSASYVGGVWTLHAPRFESVSPIGVTEGNAAQMTWRALLRPSDVRTLFYGDNNVVAASARRALDGGASVRPATYYQTQLQRGWAAPMAALVMLLMAAPVTMANFRSGGAQLLTLCLGSGMTFLVVDGFLTAMGESGVAPAFLAAWAAPAIFAAAGLTVLLNMEG